MIAIPLRVGDDAAAVARRLTAVAVGLVALARLDIEEHGLPTLYEAARAGRIRFQREPRGVELWLCPSLALLEGVVDCEDASAWRAADYQRRGVRARVEIQPQSTPRLYHAVVRLPDGRIVDPSARLIAIASSLEGKRR